MFNEAKFRENQNLPSSIMSHLQWLLIALRNLLSPSSTSSIASVQLHTFSLNMRDIIIYVARRWEKYLSKRILLKHTCLRRDNLIRNTKHTSEKFFTYTSALLRKILYLKLLIIAIKSGVCKDSASILVERTLSTPIATIDGAIFEFYYYSQTNRVC